MQKNFIVGLPTPEKDRITDWALLIPPFERLVELPCLYFTSIIVYLLLYPTLMIVPDKTCWHPLRGRVSKFGQTIGT